MSCPDIREKMSTFYTSTLIGGLIPVVGPLIVSPLSSLIALVDMAVSTIFSSRENLNGRELQDYQKDFMLRNLSLKYHVINTLTLGIVPWAYLIRQECCKN